MGHPTAVDHFRMTLRVPLRWPTRMLGPAPSLKTAALICWGAWLGLLAVPLGVTALHQDPTTFDADFVNFYMLGRILNEYPHDRLYDHNLQTSIAERVHPLKSGSYGPVAYPPAVAIIFQPLAALPYGRAYWTWLVITITLYVSSILLLGQSLFPARCDLLSLLLCLSLAFFPFVIETLAGGQLTAIGFFALSMAIREEKKQQQVASGMWIAVCLYKPTLLIWVVPMLVVTRRWKALAGFSAGAAVFLSVTTAIAGVSVWKGYLSGSLRFPAGPLRYFVRPTEARVALPFSKYVDITSFTSLLTQRAPWLALPVFVAVGLVAAAALGRRWRNNNNQDLVWATAISATLIVNLYTPIYDATLAVIGTMLTISGAWWKLTQTARTWLLMLLLAILAVSWESVGLAVATHVQPMTLLFTGLGLMQYRALRDCRPSGIIEKGERRVTVRL